MRHTPREKRGRIMERFGITDADWRLYVRCLAFVVFCMFLGPL